MLYGYITMHRQKTLKTYIVVVPFIMFRITYNVACVRVKCIVTVSMLLLTPNLGKVTDDVFCHITRQGYSVHCRAHVCRLNTHCNVYTRN